MRRVFLWMARNRWLREHVPNWWFAKRAVHRFMPGERLDDALAAAETFAPAGITAFFTRLGENLTELAEADAIAAHYLDALEQIRSRGMDGEISVKLTQLGLDLDPEVARRHVAALAGRARELGLGTVWIDMEGSEYTETTVAMYEALKREHANLGICLQAYLRRTAADITRLLPLNPSIRMVKGAYDEPASHRVSHALGGGRQLRGAVDGCPAGKRRHPRSRDARRAAHRADRVGGGCGRDRS